MGTHDISKPGTVSPPLGSFPSNGKRKITDFTKAAELLITKSGEFLVCSNRGNGSNTVSVFKVPAANPRDLKWVGTYDTGVSFPRGMAFDPTEGHLVVLGQGSGNMVTMKFNRRTGVLTKTLFNMKGLPTPVTI